MQHHLENEHLAASFREQGAELCSLRSKAHDTEYIWEGNPRIWGRHAPVLFPIVGKLKDNSYRLDGKVYHLNQHGFARDQDWRVSAEEAGHLQFKLQPTEELRTQYPFEWELYIDYYLHEKTLSTKYTLKNADSRELLFSIGGHPAFRCPLEAELEFSDYYLEFEQNERASRQTLNGGLRTPDQQPVLKNEKKLPLSEELFSNDALIFSKLNSNQVYLKSDKNERGLAFKFEGFPYLGVWSKAGGAPFVCLEPWYGLADTEEGQADLSQKEGIQRLGAGQRFSCQYQISPF